MLTLSTGDARMMAELPHSAAAGLSADADSVSAEGLSTANQQQYGHGPKIELAWQVLPKPRRVRWWRSGMVIAGGAMAAAAMLVAGAAAFTSLAGTEPEDAAQVALPPPVLDTAVLPPVFVQPQLLRIAAEVAEVPEGVIIEPDAPAAIAAPLQLRAAEAGTFEEDPAVAAAPVVSQPAVFPRSSGRRESGARAAAADRSWTGSFFERQN